MRTRHALIHADQAPGLIVGSAGSDDDRRGAGSGVNKLLLRASSGRRFPGPGGDRWLRGARIGVIKALWSVTSRGRAIAVRPRPESSATTAFASSGLER